MTSADEQPEAEKETASTVDPAPGEPESETAADAKPQPEAAAEPAAGEPAASGDDTVAALQATVEERTRDLQRVTAEYHNYRKRVERDRVVAAEQTTAAVLAGLLPVLDDIDRAREHGDLVGPFGAVAEQLQTALSKLGLEAFGEKGDVFNPLVHEAVAHMHSPDVSEPTCIDVMRRGFKMGERLVRPAMVAVAEPADEPAPSVEAAEESVEPAEATAPPVGDSPDEEAPAADEPADATEPRATDAEADADADVERGSGGVDVDEESPAEADQDLRADVPDDEEAQGAEIVADAVGAAADGDAEAVGQTGDERSESAPGATPDDEPDADKRSEHKK